MTRQSDIDTNTAAGSRGPAEIEKEIDRTRQRMDQMLDELEYRLSPGQVMSLAYQELTSGQPGRLGAVIRRNPIPAVMIGIGVLWLGLALARERPGTIEGTARRPSMAPGELSNVLSPLVAMSRQGADALRQAQSVIDEPQLAAFAADFAEQNDLAAGALEAELRARGAAVVAATAATTGAGVAAPSHPHPAWSELRRAIATRDRTALLDAIESGADAALEAYRGILRHELPEQTRVMVGAHFHATEQMHNRVSAMKHSTVG
jgi:uncharacterized protein (TIGR02284 family)